MQLSQILVSKMSTHTEMAFMTFFLSLARILVHLNNIIEALIYPAVEDSINMAK
jgi:hypothetical protein